LEKFASFSELKHELTVKSDPKNYKKIFLFGGDFFTHPNIQTHKSIPKKSYVGIDKLNEGVLLVDNCLIKKEILF